MASIKVIFRLPSANSSEGALYYRVTHRRKVRQIHAGIRIVSGEWDDDNKMLTALAAPDRIEYLKGAEMKMGRCLKRLEHIVAALDLSGDEYTADDVVDRFHSSDTVMGFVSFARKLCDESRLMGKVCAAEHISSAINSFLRFYGSDEIDFCDIDSALMMRYEQYLKDNGRCLNTVSFYMRKLRAIYNQAVEQGYTRQCAPFKRVYTGIAKTSKRAVALDVIKMLKDMDLHDDPHSELARDVFLFSFYTRGMSMIDISYLRKDNLKNGILTYRRRKTHQELSMRWEDKMQEIVSRHAEPGSDFLLPIVKSDGGDSRRQYLNALHMINRRLKKLGESLGLAYPLTMYRARHSWASIAMTNQVPISVISQGMGHDSEKTTRIYLASLEASVVDEANSKIISLLV